MEKAVREALGTSLFRAKTGMPSGGGSISSGCSYETDFGPVFVKLNNQVGAKRMFEGELESLKAIEKTKTIRVPQPIKVVETPDSCCLVMEHFELHPCNREQEARLGQQLARMHAHNGDLMGRLGSEERRVGGEEEGEAVQGFGFDLPTCCGYLPLDNTWTDTWTTFYIRRRLQPQIERLVQSGERELEHTSELLLRKVDAVLSKTPPFRPALLHGDLWSGNFAAVDGEPVVYDPASFYGHSEFDFGIAHMFGGFSGAFFQSYHDLSPKAKGFQERADIYELFHHLNHWNHFGGRYKSSSMKLMKKIMG